MVSESGQLYTIEGFAAALIMILAAIFVFGATTVYAAGDEHITDMQLEQIANDALTVMDTPLTLNTASKLSECIENGDNYTFHADFMSLITMKTGAASIQVSNLQYNATVFYYDLTEVGEYTFDKSEYYEPAGRDHAAREPSIRASRWVYLDGQPDEDMRPGKQLVLLEVLVWRG